MLISAYPHIRISAYPYLSSNSEARLDAPGNLTPSPKLPDPCLCNHTFHGHIKLVSPSRLIRRPALIWNHYAAKKKARERSRLRYQGQRLLSDAILKRNGHAPMHWQATSTPPSSSDRSVSSSNPFFRICFRQPSRSVTNP